MHAHSFTILVAISTLVPVSFGLALTSSKTTPVSLHARADLAQVYMDCNEPNTVALTFDDGPASYHKNVSNRLKMAGIKGTFFVNGNNYDCIYDAAQVSSLRTSFGAGHQIASHTWSHPDLTTLSQSQIRGELTRINTALQNILGVVPSVMRPPYGSYNDNVRRVVAEVGQSVVLWNFDSGDSTGSTPAASKQAYTELANRHPPTIISLQHETRETTVDDVLPFAIQTLRDKGYKFVTISECLGIPAYISVRSPGTRDSSWTC